MREKINYSWESFEEDMKNLSAKILSTFKPDAVVSIATGGWVPARVLKNYIKADFFSLGGNSYDDRNNTQGKLEFYQEIESSMIKGKKVLVIDEMCETGVTMKTALEKIQAFGPKELKSAVIHTKPKSIIKPDFYIWLAGPEWIVYPWEKIKE